MSRFTPLLVTCAGLAIAHPAVAQQACNPNIPATTPTADFEFHGDGTVTHTPTHLTWQRCFVGQSLDDNGTPGDPADDRCTGTATPMTWQEALQYAEAQADWRLPNIKESASVREYQCRDPAVNLDVFPHLDVVDFNLFWSATAASYDRAWTDYSVQDTSRDFSVRLVRGGQ